MQLPVDVTLALALDSAVARLSYSLETFQCPASSGRAPDDDVYAYVMAAHARPRPLPWPAELRMQPMAITLGMSSESIASSQPQQHVEATCGLLS